MQSRSFSARTPRLRHDDAIRTIDINWNGRIANWRFGPEEVSFYHLLLRKENELFYMYPPVKRSGRHFFARGFADNENIYIRILYRLPDGSEVVSPSKSKYSYRDMVPTSLDQKRILQWDNCVC